MNANLGQITKRVIASFQSVKCTFKNLDMKRVKKLTSLPWVEKKVNVIWTVVNFILTNFPH